MEPPRNAIAVYRELAPCAALASHVHAFFTFGPVRACAPAPRAVLRETFFAPGDSFCSPLLADGNVSLVLSSGMTCEFGGALARRPVGTFRPRDRPDDDGRRNRRPRVRGRRRRVFPARASIDVRRDADRRAHRSHHRRGRRLGRRGPQSCRRSYPSSTTAHASTGSRLRCSSGSRVTTRVSSESTLRDWRRAFSTATVVSASSRSRPRPVCRGNTWRAYFANASALRRRPAAASHGSNRASPMRAAVESTGRRPPRRSATPINRT